MSTTTMSTTNILTTDDLDLVVENLEAMPVVQGFQPEARYILIDLLNAMGINATGSLEQVLMNAMRAIAADLEDAETVAVARPFRASQMRRAIQLKLDAIHNFALVVGEHRDGGLFVAADAAQACAASGEAPTGEVRQ
ncbi:MAG: hypothetical protein HOO96_29470 [Polyangiaceae bacterium]|nr:hypothetical protein [Polyangiaceae bacterium]